MLEKTYNRFKGIVASKQIFIITSSAQLKDIKKQLPQVPLKNFILEPEPRGTAAAIGLAAACLKGKNRQNVMVIVPADQHITSDKIFRTTVKRAVSLASSGNLITIGIKPTFAATGYGYLKFGERVKSASTYGYKVEKFIEKPSLAKAKRFLSSGSYYFNCGMFVWRQDIFLDEIKTHMPSLAKTLKISGEKVFSREKKIKSISSNYKKLKPISIDYGLMQKTKKILAIKAGFGWSDLGSLKSLEEIGLKKQKSNIIINALSVSDNTDSCIIYGEKNHLIATIGVSGLIIIQTPDATLVAKKEEAQKIKKIVDRLTGSKQLTKYA